MFINFLFLEKLKNMAEEVVEEKREAEDYSIEYIKNYRPIALVGGFQQAGDRSTIDKIIIDIFKTITPKTRNADREGILRAIKSSEQGVANFVNHCAEQYQENLNNTKVSELRNLYDDWFKKFYTPENLVKVDEEFKLEDTYIELKKKYDKENEIVKSETGNFSEEQKKAAKEKADKLERIILPIEQFEIKEIEKIKGPVSDDSLKQRLNAHYEEKKKEEEKSKGE